MSENGPYVELRGSLSTDGDTIYVGGMDLANILRASLPSRDDLGSLGKNCYGHALITIERTDA